MPSNAKETAKTLISYYNATNPEEPLILIDPSELIDTNNLYICLYNDNEIGLFIKEQLKSEEKRKEYRSGYSTLSFPEYKYYYYAADIYVGYDDISIIGINVLHREENTVNEWSESGYETSYSVKHYKSTCHINDYISYNKIREKMIQNGKLEFCLFSKTTQEEIEIVLEYAKEYFGLSTPKEKKRIQE